MAKKSAGVISLEYWAARLFLGLLGMLPRRSAIRLATWLMLLVSKLLSNLRRTGLRNLDIAFPEKTRAEKEAILRGTFENLGRVLGDLSQVPKMSRDDIGSLIDY